MTAEAPSSPDAPPLDPLGLTDELDQPVLPTVLSVLLATVIVLAATGLALQQIHRQQLEIVETRLANRVESRMELVENWSEAQQKTALTWATDRDVVAATEGLVAAERTTDALVDHPDQDRLAELLDPVLRAHGFQGYLVVAADGTSLASTGGRDVGTPNLVADEQADRFAAVLGGAVVMTVPQLSDVPLEAPDGSVDETAPTMFVGAPVYGGRDGEVLAALLFQVDAVQSFMPVFTRGRSIQPGEVFAFDGDGRLLVPSRYTDRLRSAGLIGDVTFEPLSLRDPGGPLPASVDPAVTADWPLTAMARSATGGRDGIDVDGYRSYHGGEVLGAWMWNDDLGLGIAAEEAPDQLLAGWRFARNTVLALAAGVLVLVTGLGWYLGLSRPKLVSSGAAATERARRLQTVLDQSSDGMLLVDSNGRIVLANEAMNALFGYEPAELLGEPVDRLVDPLHRPGHHDQVLSFLTSQRPRGLMAAESRSVMASRRDGSLFPVEVTLSRVELAGDHAVLAGVRDLSADVRAVELSQALRELERLTAVAAHDLREPLRKVEALSDLLEISLGPDARSTRNIIDRLQAATTRMRALTDDLGRYIDWSTREQQYESIDLGQVVSEVVGRLHRHRGDHPADIDIDIDVGELPVVWGDRAQLGELLLQLLDNALKFQDDRAMVTIWAESSPSQDMDVIVLRDNGIGIAADQTDRVFDAFRTLRPAGDTRYRGNGIGLAIGRRIVERHRGRIRAESSPGRGTTITVELPRRRIQATDEPRRPSGDVLAGGPLR